MTLLALLLILVVLGSVIFQRSRIWLDHLGTFVILRNQQIVDFAIPLDPLTQCHQEVIILADPSRSPSLRHQNVIIPQHPRPITKM